jgi:type IV pilus assembly protein PilA
MGKFGSSGFGSVKLVSLLGGVVLLGAAAYSYLLPVYRDSQVQAKVAEVFVSTDVCRTEIAKIVQKTTAPALSTALFGCDGGASAGIKISSHLKSIAVGNAGKITVTLDFRSLTELSPVTSTLTMVPLVEASTDLGVGDVHKNIVAWRCGNPQDGTTILSKYLPSNCRG